MVPASAKAATPEGSTGQRGTDHGSKSAGISPLWLMGGAGSIGTGDPVYSLAKMVRKFPLFKPRWASSGRPRTPWPTALFG